jgi:hypothetical protein
MLFPFSKTQKDTNRQNATCDNWLMLTAPEVSFPRELVN